jgi:gluconate 2-dehydrogenase gamma chain
VTALDRRQMLRLLGAAPVAAGFVWTEAEAAQAHHQAQAARQTARKAGVPYKPKFFTASEYATVTMLADLIIPKDERSGSASDAGVPEFVDFIVGEQIVGEQDDRQTAMRGGLAWIDRECEMRFEKRFVDCTDEQRRALLDDISVPDPPGSTRPPKTALSHGIEFFRSFRDLTASGFWTSKMGIADLQFMGNTLVAEWKGCPEEALKKLGVSAE